MATMNNGTPSETSSPGNGARTAVERVTAREINYGRVCWQGCRLGTNVDVVRASAIDEYAQVLDDSFLIIMRTLRTFFET